MLGRDTLRSLATRRAIDPAIPPTLSLTTGFDANTPALEIDASARYCQELTRREAKNFYWGFIALPKSQRIAIYALYSFAREVDDAVDLAGSAFTPNGTESDPRIEMLQLHRERLRRCFVGDVNDPIMHVLSRAVERYGIPHDELEALVRGVEMDLSVTRYETWEDFRRYSSLVASAVGRMCVRVFGFSDPAALELADELGVAMQLANMLRDVREDYGRDRIYLPQEDLQRHQVSEEMLANGNAGPEWESLVRFEIERARACFATGLRVTDFVPRRAAACVHTMAGIYQAILDRIELDPFVPLQERISLNSRSKLAVMAKSWARAI